MEIAPGERIGPFTLGLTEDQLAVTCRSIAGYRVHVPGRTSPRGSHAYDFGMFVKARFNGQGLVQAVQVSGSGAFISYNANYAGINLLATPAAEVIALLSVVDELRGDEFRFRIIAPRLGLALTRPTVPEDDEDEDGKYFTSVLAAYPGSVDVTA